MRQSDIEIRYENGQKTASLRAGTTDVHPEAFIQMAKQVGAQPKDYNGVVGAVVRDEQQKIAVAKVGAQIYSSGLSTALDVAGRSAIREAIGLPNRERIPDIDADARMLGSVGASYGNEVAQRQARIDYLQREVGK